MIPSALDRASFDYALEVLALLEALAIPRDRVLLVGTQQDRSTERDVSRQEADLRAETLHVRHLTASALERQTVERCFNWVISKSIAVDTPSCT